MIAVRADARPERLLSVLIDLDADGTGKIITDAQDDAEHAEALRRLRAWCDRHELDALLADVEGGAS